MSKSTCFSRWSFKSDLECYENKLLSYEKEEYQRLQQHYRFNESFEEWITDKANRLFILKRGVEEYIHEKLIPAAYQKAFENGIPDHPKEEYLKQD